MGRSLSPVPSEEPLVEPSGARGRPPGLSRRRSLALPPGFAHAFETFTDNSTGVTFQAGYEGLSQYQPPKVLRYDPSKLFYSTAAWWGLMAGPTRAATATTSLVTRVFSFAILAALFGILGTTATAGSNSEEALTSLNTMLATGLFFLVGPYIGGSVTRWWAVRKDGIGGLWGAVDDLCMWAAAYFDQKTSADRTARSLVLRYGLLSHALLYKQARGEEDQLDDLLAAGLLLPHEQEALQPLASKPLVVWAWLSHFWAQALAGELQVTPIPHAAQLAPMVLGKCAQGRGALGLSLSYVDSQQPFPYVHLLALLTDLALIVNAAAVGLSVGRDLQDADTHRAEVMLLLLCAFLRIGAFVLVFNGLLAVAVVLDNPLGDDSADLPALAYHSYMKKECDSFSAAVDAIDKHHGWWEGLCKDNGEGRSGGGGGGDVPEGRAAAPPRRLPASGHRVVT